MKTSRVRHPCRLLCAGLAALFLAVPALSAPAKEEPKAPEPLETELVGIRNSIINASGKLKNNVVGISESDGSGPQTPARTCCSLMVKKIEERIERAHRILEAFDHCYEIEGDQAALLDARVAQSDLQAFEVTVPQFRDAPTRAKARAGINSMTRTYLLLRETAVKLRACERSQSLMPPQSDDTSEP